MSQEEIDKHFASAKADNDKRDAKESQSSTEYKLKLILQKLDAINERLVNIENAIVPKGD